MKAYNPSLAKIRAMTRADILYALQHTPWSQFETEILREIWARVDMEWYRELKRRKDGDA